MPPCLLGSHACLQEALGLEGQPRAALKSLLVQLRRGCGQVSSPRSSDVSFLTQGQLLLRTCRRLAAGLAEEVFIIRWHRHLTHVHCGAVHLPSDPVVRAEHSSRVCCQKLQAPRLAGLSPRAVQGKGLQCGHRRSITEVPEGLPTSGQPQHELHCAFAAIVGTRSSARVLTQDGVVRAPASGLPCLQRPALVLEAVPPGQLPPYELVLASLRGGLVL
mmetsp:Transcript_12883/g.40472  ORF Transcript_12883/g.40472 Transcript_12883/m.40472 type:complete len:218 (+) Transcript_12883:303-956(+)